MCKSQLRFRYLTAIHYSVRRWKITHALVSYIYHHRAVCIFENRGFEINYFLYGTTQIQDLAYINENLRDLPFHYLKVHLNLSVVFLYIFLILFYFG